MGIKQKSPFFKIANSQFFFLKISWIGPWVSRIGWCEAHWFGSTYMAVRLSEESSKTGKKCIFLCFLLFFSLCRTPWRLYTLSHINALCINQSYQPKDQSVKFSQNFFENWRFWKTQFFWVWFPENSLLCILLRYTVHIHSHHKSN